MVELVRENDNRTLEVLLDHVKELEGLYAQIGWFESARYDEETPVAMVAAQNEFGNPEKNIPPRPFIRPAISDHSKVWQQLVASGAKAIAAGNETATSVMEAVTATAAGQIRDKIKEVYSPSLSPVTLLKRLNDLDKARGIKRPRQKQEDRVVDFIVDDHTITKPLVFAGILLNTLTYVVADGPEVQPWIDQANDTNNVYGSRPA